MLKNYSLRFIILFAIFCNNFSFAQSTLSGYLRESDSREALIGASIFCKEAKKGTVSNNYGYYLLNLPAMDSVTILVSYVGFQTKEIRVFTKNSVQFDIELSTQGTELQAVTVKAEQPLSQSNMSIMRLDPKMVKEIPALLGEKDILKVIQLLPGVQSSNEGGSGLSVRGGGADQNLVILDDMPIYNVSHLFGFFSIFNGYAVKDIQFLKGNFPAKYGGRLSSVIEVTMKEGDKEKFKGEGGIGLISSRMTFEGPLKKQKASFLVSGRSMYQQFLAAPFFKLSAYRSPVFNFYDFNVKANIQLSQKDNLYFSSYLGKDAYGTKGVLDESTNRTSRETIEWGNRTASLRWNHVFSPRLFSNFVLGTTNYHFTSLRHAKDDGKTQFNLRSGSDVTDLILKGDFTFAINSKNTIKAGFIGFQHFFTPTKLFYETQNGYTINGFSGLFEDTRREKAKEAAIYIENTYQISSKIEVNTGLRQSLYNVTSKNYQNLEPRLSIGYKHNSHLNFSAAYAKMSQYVHLVSNSGIALPTDLWIPSTNNILPQIAHQASLGATYNTDNQKYTFSAEAYYKTMQHIVGYREGANFLQLDFYNTNPIAVDWQNLITQGKGNAYGVEFFLQKNNGKLTGWAAYTFGKVQHQFEELNFGKTFAPRQDRRHSLNLVGLYSLNKKVKFSGTWVFSTGNPVQIPLSVAYIKPHLGTANQQIIEYGARDSYRNPAYHRLDFAVQLHKQKKRITRYWEFSVFNLYNRLNPISYNIGNRDVGENQSKFVLEKVSLFVFTPSVSYNFKF
jgi:hypothetical protein